MTGNGPDDSYAAELSDEEFREEYGVPRQESYTCLSCGKTAYRPVDEIEPVDPDAAQIQYIGEDDEAIIVCWECLQDDDWEERVHQRRTEQQSNILISVLKNAGPRVVSIVSRVRAVLTQADSPESSKSSTNSKNPESISTVDDADRHRTREERLAWKLEQEQEWSTYLEKELQAKEDTLTDLREKLHRLQQANEGVPPDGPMPGGYTDLLTALFDVRDSLGKAMAEARDTDNPGIVKGLQQVDRQIETTLHEAGIERIDTDGASKPRYHRTVETIPTGAHPPGEILEVYQSGYRRGDEILRPAHVAVAEPPEDEEDSPRDESVGSSDEPVGGGEP